VRPTFRPRRLEDVNRAYTDALARGFPTAPFDGEPEPETLQCRNDLDRTNWLGLLIKCQAVVATSVAMDIPEIADAPVDPPFRCTSNRMYAPSYRDSVDRLFALFDMVASAQANNWRMKDLVAAAQSNEDLRAIDLNEGWP